MRSCVHTRSSEPSRARTRFQAAHQHPQAGGVEELDLLHVHHELVKPGVHQFDQKLTQARCSDKCASISPSDLDDLDPILGVVIQLQIHKILQRQAVRVKACSPLAGTRAPWCGNVHPRAFNHALTSCLYHYWESLRGTLPRDDTLKPYAYRAFARRKKSCPIPSRRRPDPRGRAHGPASPSGARARIGRPCASTGPPGPRRKWSRRSRRPGCPAPWGAPGRPRPTTPPRAGT